MRDKSVAEAVAGFSKAYGKPPVGVAFAPGRVNIIGEHTDYNGGWVLPAAVDLATYVAYGPSGDSKARVFSTTTNESAEFELNEAAKGSLAFWARYPWGTGMSLQEAGLEVAPLEMYAVSSVPLGGGLSSSASFEVALALGFLGPEQAQGVGKERLVHLCRRAENHFVGVNCGVMDQFSSVFGADGKALLLDCRSLESSEVPFPEKMALIVADTTVRHALGEHTEGYHERQDECHRAVDILREHNPGVETLRDATLEMIEGEKERLGDVLFRRARHVIMENDRVLEAAEALVADDMEWLGALLAESHKSLRHDFEVSCRELDMMVDAAEGISGHYGSRMVGGGFGGCTVSLVRMRKAKGFAKKLARLYKEATGLEPDVHIVCPGRGAGFVEM